MALVAPGPAGATPVDSRPEGINQLVLCARLAEVRPLRYTPAGIAALDVLLDHESTVTQSGTHRSVKLSLKAVAFGVQAESLVRADLAAPWLFKGFLAPGRNGKGIVFHIQEIQRI